VIRSSRVASGVRPPRATKRVPAAPSAGTTQAASNTGERLSKRVMQLKGCSRAQAEQYIADGWVQVDGAVVRTPQLRVLQQLVVVDPAATLQDANPITLVLHKPAAGQTVRGHAGWCRGKKQPQFAHTGTALRQ